MSRLDRLGKYDGTLHMLVVENPPPIDMDRLGFLRWLAEGSPDDGYALGPSSGPLAQDRPPTPRDSGHD